MRVGKYNFGKNTKKPSTGQDKGLHLILFGEAIQMQSTWKIHQIVTLGLVHFTPIAKNKGNINNLEDLIAD